MDACAGIQEGGGSAIKTVMIVDDSDEVYSPQLVSLKTRYQTYNILTSHDIVNTVSVQDRLTLYRSFIDIADVVHFSNLDKQSDMSKTLYDYAVVKKKAIVRNEDFANDLDKFVYCVNQMSVALSRKKLKQMKDFDEMIEFVLVMLERAQYSKIKPKNKNTQQLVIDFKEGD